jgi:hypothetical protein
VKHYRIYKLDKPQGQIIKGKDAHAATDEAAIQEAAADPDCPVCEVWQGIKKVGSVEG